MIRIEWRSESDGTVSVAIEADEFRPLDDISPWIQAWVRAVAGSATPTQEAET